MSYANVVCHSHRHRTASVSSGDSRGTSSSFADFGEFVHNHNRMTAFECDHWNPGNILSEGPCSAFFHVPDKNISSTAIFQAFNSIGIPVSSVRCLQRNPSGVAFLTFSSSDVCKRFLQKSPWIPRRDNNYQPSSLSTDGVTYVTIYDAPYELSNSIEKKRNIWTGKD